MAARGLCRAEIGRGYGHTSARLEPMASYDHGVARRIGTGIRKDEGCVPGTSQEGKVRQRLEAAVGVLAQERKAARGLCLAQTDRGSV
jgi:hypothetical protein